MEKFDRHRLIAVGLVCLLLLLQFTGLFAPSLTFSAAPSSGAAVNSPKPRLQSPPPQSGPPTITSFSLYGKVSGTNPTTVNVAGFTYTPAARLKISFTGGQLQVTHYRASESPNFSNAAWIVLQAGQDPVFSFSGFPQAAEGLKTVYVQLMNPSGISNIKNAQITYRLPPQITTLSLGTGTPNAAVTNTRQVQLVWTKTGNSTHYRAGENTSSFQGQQFLPLPASGPPTFTLSAVEGDKTVYLQLLDQAIPAQPAFNALSNVMTAGIRYKVRDLYTIEGAQVEVLRQHAVSRGFSFSCQVKEGNSCQYLAGNNGGVVLRAVPFLTCQTPGLPPQGHKICTGNSFDVRFTLFGGGSKLQTGWKLVSAMIDSAHIPPLPGNAGGAPCTTWGWTTPPQLASDNPQFGVRLQNPATPVVCAAPRGTAGGTHNGYVLLKQIQLEGPAGRDWREAF